MWTEEITETIQEYQPGKAFPVQKRAFVNEVGTRVESSRGMEWGIRGFIYKGQGIEFAMLGRMIHPIPQSGDLIFTLEPRPYAPVSRLIAQGNARPEVVAKIPKMKQDIVEAFKLLPLWLHLKPELSARPIKVVFDRNFDL